MEMTGKIQNTARKINQQTDAQAAIAKIMAPVEKRVLRNLAAKVKERPLLSLRLSKHAGCPKLEIDHEDEGMGMGMVLLMSALGSSDFYFVSGILDQLLALN